MTLSELASLLGGDLTGDGRTVVRGVGTLDSAGRDEVTFLANPRYERHVQQTKAAAVIVSRDYAGPCKSLIRCGDPYLAFREAMVAFYGFRRPWFEGIDSSAQVAEGVELGEGVRIGPHAVIAPGCRIGGGTTIYPHAYVGPNCRIGRDCTIHPNVTLYDGTILRERVTVHAGSSIGQDGFGYATHDGRHDKIPQAGWVELEDDVEIGACCAIDRATIGATIIGAGSKFSNLVAIGHGTRMGRHCLVVAQSGIAGSVKVGNHCVFAGQSGVVGHIRIGDGARIGAQAGVTNDVPAAAEYWGTPAIPLAQARRSLTSLSRLPGLRTAVRRLTKEVAALKRHLGLRGGAPGQAKEDA
jgi:UDP-3-O-[3-hydroxymyristoyl] glucosamine N-acyltransferase